MKIIRRILVLVLASTLCYSCNLLTAAGITSHGQPTKKVPEKLTSTTANSVVNVEYDDWDALLKKYVNNAGLVDYSGFQKDGARFNAVKLRLSLMKPNNNWSVQELLAYYINMYNIYTVDLILQNYPTKSIQDIKKAFTRSFIPIGNSKLSLGGIENGVLRKMGEPRIHFAINCASMSCPKLMRDAYTAVKINEQLERAAIEFINSNKNEISANDPKLSSIFKFYKKDFVPTTIDFVNKYSKTKINAGAVIQYKDYDWSLNEQK